MTSKNNDHLMDWPVALVLVVVAISGAFVLYGLSESEKDRFKYEAEIVKSRLEHQRWLLENGHIDKPTLK